MNKRKLLFFITTIIIFSSLITIKSMNQLPIEDAIITAQRNLQVALIPYKNQPNNCIFDKKALFEFADSNNYIYPSNALILIQIAINMEKNIQSLLNEYLKLLNSNHKPYCPTRQPKDQRMNRDSDTSYIPLAFECCDNCDNSCGEKISKCSNCITSFFTKLGLYCTNLKNNAYKDCKDDCSQSCKHKGWNENLCKDCCKNPHNVTYNDKCCPSNHTAYNSGSSCDCCNCSCPDCGDCDCDD